jgi:hypothetical protein
MSKIDLIIDALSVAQSSVWSALNQEALAYAIELKLELAKPEPQVCCGDYEKCIKACTPRGRWLAEKELVKPEQELVALQSIEQYRMQMSAICTAAIGYWKESDSIHLDYDTLALRDVAKLYAKYAELYTAPPRKEWIGLSINEGRDFFESKLTRAELIAEINEFLEEKNT